MAQPIRPASEPTTPSQATLAVVVVNYRSWPDVLSLVEALRTAPEVVQGRCEILVVDNASDEPVPEAFSSAWPGVRLLTRPDNGGFAAGVNAGWKATRCPWLLLLNPDVIAGPELIGRVLERIEREATASNPMPTGIVGFGLRNADGTRQPSVGAFPSLVRSVCEVLLPRERRKYQADWRVRPGPVAWVTGACMLVKAELLEQLGGMDEDFFLYHEEVALCRSARDRGWRVEYDPSIEVVHLHPLQNREVSPKLRVITRHSKLLYFRKHLPRWQFEGLAAIIALESRLRRLWCRLRGHVPEAEAWRIVSELAPALRRTIGLRGRAVLRLAEALPKDGSDRNRTPAPVKGRSRIALDPSRR